MFASANFGLPQCHHLGDLTQKVPDSLYVCTCLVILVIKKLIWPVINSHIALRRLDLKKKFFIWSRKQGGLPHWFKKNTKLRKNFFEKSRICHLLSHCSIIYHVAAHILLEWRMYTPIWKVILSILRSHKIIPKSIWNLKIGVNILQSIKMCAATW